MRLACLISITDRFEALRPTYTQNRTLSFLSCRSFRSSRSRHCKHTTPSKDAQKALPSLLSVIKLPFPLRVHHLNKCKMSSLGESAVGGERELVGEHETASVFNGDDSATTHDSIFRPFSERKTVSNTCPTCAKVSTIFRFSSGFPSKQINPPPCAN